MSEHIGAEAEYWRDRYNAGADLLHQMEVERDAARAEVVRLRRELDAATEGTRRAAQALWGGE